MYNPIIMNNLSVFWGFAEFFFTHILQDYFPVYSFPSIFENNDSNCEVYVWRWYDVDEYS